MKSLKIVSGIFIMLAITGALFAFNYSAKKGAIKVEKSAFSLVTYSFTTSISQPSLTRSQIDDQTNWTLFTSPDPCNHLGSKLCSIKFNDTNTTLTQALALIPPTPSGGYVDGTIYSSGSQSVTIYTRS
ncbi:hypothetical protein SAMN05444410_10174 [Hydrobacter penzbergensis]|uniref:Uncharacterized protein n=1 Tax=Hydrobacter penzbergensis TaxID=1235997 RepID=A0A8X8I8D8_9BACT|nr:hypothetical protein [Hydrobacter penzbergensis]SDW03454.1 hypothetical protein SAMN05444410_10174 [Hydrobacter penzbergensis]